MQKNRNNTYDFTLTPSDISKNWRRKKPIKRRILAGFLTLILSLNIITTSAMASVSHTNKEEIIYINLHSDGSVDNIYVVNVFDLDEDGKIIDYGDYTSLRNLTNNDALTFEDQKVTVDTTAGKFYYEGQLNHQIIPWDFDISYTLDNDSMTADDIAGMSGYLELKIDINQNNESISDFFDNYGLQISLQLDGNKTSHLIADKATEANVGKYRQLTYTVLPGEEETFIIEADVLDFEMSGISINAVPLVMDIDIDLEDNEDIIDLQEGITELTDGSVELDDGATDLLGGTTELKDGVIELDDGTDELYDGVVELREGVIELLDGATDLDEGASDLLDGSLEIDDGMTEMVDGSIELDDGVAELLDGIADMSEGTTKLTDGFIELQDGLVDLNEGSLDLYSGAGDLEDGSKTLYSGAKSLDEGSEELLSGLITITNQNSTLQDTSTILFNSTLTEVSPLLDAHGYTVTGTTSLDTLQEYLADRQASLTSEDEQTAATNTAINNRVVELSTIVAGGSDEEKAIAQPSLDYWQMTMAIQGESGYQLILAQSDQVTADASSYAALHFAYNDYVTAFGSYESFMEAYSLIDGQVGASEQTLIETNVTQSLTETVSNDDVINSLGLLSYYQGIIEYCDAVTSATNGAAQVRTGSASLLDGSSDLYEGLSELRGGTIELLNGMSELSDGINELNDGVIELNDGVIELNDGVLELSDGIDELNEGVLEVKDGSTELVDGVIELKDGTTKLLDGVIDLDEGSLELYDGVVELKDGVISLLDGAIELNDGSIELKDGTVELLDGTIELKDKSTTASLQDKIKKTLDETLKQDINIYSFTSPHNGEVDLVQFIMKTPAIELEEVTYQPQEETETLTIWEKFIAVFN